MKLTIHIPDHHAGDVLQFVASLRGQAVAEPAPNHPELNLTGDTDNRPSMDIKLCRTYVTRNGTTVDCARWSDSADHVDAYIAAWSSTPIHVRYNRIGQCITPAFASREWDIVAEA